MLQNIEIVRMSNENQKLLQARVSIEIIKLTSFIASNIVQKYMSARGFLLPQQK